MCVGGCAFYENDDDGGGGNTTNVLIWEKRCLVFVAFSKVVLLSPKRPSERVLSSFEGGWWGGFDILAAVLAAEQSH